MRLYIHAGYGKNQNQNAAGCDIFAVFSTSFFFVLVAFFPVFFFRLKVKKSGILLFRFHEIFWFFAIALVSPSRLPSHALFEKVSAEREGEIRLCLRIRFFLKGEGERGSCYKMDILHVHVCEI